MSKKDPINPKDVVNELRGKSTYFEKPNDRTGEQTNERANGIASEAVNKKSERATKRMSFEGYVDHEATIKEIQHLYYKQTGKDLPSSRVIREALDEYLPKLLEALSGQND